MPIVYIALGTNLGDRMANLEAAIQAFPPALQVLALSPIYQTAPWGYPDQPDFLNMVVRVDTNLPPHELLAYLKRVEETLGRTLTFRNGPRLIDLDILFYNELVLDTSSLAIPHPRLSERAFVLVPLANLAPDLRHPVLEKTVKEMLDSVDLGTVKPYG